MVSASSVLLIALTVASVSIFGTLVAVTVGFSVELATFKSQTNNQPNVMPSSPQFQSDSRFEDMAAINASMVWSSHLQQLIRDISSINASTVSNYYILQQRIQDMAEINSSLVASNNTNLHYGGNTEVQAQIEQLNTSLNKLSLLLQQQLPGIDRLNISLTQQIASMQAQIKEVAVVIESFGLQPFPASSCAAIQSTLPSGLYWIRDVNGNGIQVYCNMNKTCGNLTGGWTRVINLDFNSSDACRNNFTQRSTSNLILCELSSTAARGCVEVDMFFTFGLNYSAVCGRVIAYQLGTPEAFARSIVVRSSTIDSQYLDGISLTHGSSPREHIWSFPVGVSQGRDDRFGCPCVRGSRASPSAFVGTNYFCDSAASSLISGMFYPDNPLFDGVGCNTTANNCCSFNNPPWFYRQLPHSTADDIEMRVCLDESRDNERIPIQIIDLYVR